MNSSRAIGSATVIVVLVTGSALGQVKRDQFQPAMDSASVQQVEQARQLLAKGREAEAVVSLQKLTTARPDYYRAHYNLGLALAQQGKLDEAMVALERAVAVRDKLGIQDYSIFNTLGWLQMMKGDYAAARPFFLKAEEHEAMNTKATNTKLFNNLGLMYMYLGDFENSRQYLSKAATTYKSAQAKQGLELLGKIEVQQSARKNE